MVPVSIFTWDVYVGNAGLVDRDADADAMERTRQELEATLSTLSSEAEAMVHPARVTGTRCSD